MSDMNLSLKQINQWLSGAQLHGDAHLTIQRVNTDSRTCQAGDLFVALKGERFDANDFLAQVAASGATAALAERGLDAAKLAASKPRSAAQPWRRWQRLAPRSHSHQSVHPSALQTSRPLGKCGCRC